MIRKSLKIAANTKIYETKVIQKDMKTIYTKLAELKKEVGKMTKDSKNPFFNSKYFDINQLLEHLEPLLQKNGLIVLQPIINKEVVSKIIEIETGDEICSSLELPPLTDPQKIGSAITYYRRYTLQSLLGIQAEDDDANKASGKETKKEPIPTKIEPEKWLNVDSEEWNALAKVVENGTTVTLAQVRKKYKVSKETQKALETLNIF